jgi:hypothetical protein
VIETGQWLDTMLSEATDRRFPILATLRAGRSQTILLERERIKRKTIQNRRLLRHKQAA